MVLKGSRFITVRWDDCVGGQSWSSGEWVLFGKDGFRLNVDPAQWENAKDIGAAIEAHVPERLRILVGLFAGVAGTTSVPVSRPAPQISFDPATNAMTYNPVVPDLGGTGSGDINPGFLVMAVLGAGATLRTLRGVQRRRR